MVAILLAVSLTVVVSWVAAAKAQGGPPVYSPASGLPSFRLLQQTATVSPSNALTFYGSASSPAASARGVRVVQIAQGLQSSPPGSAEAMEAIYQFVLNEFDFEPQFGLHKGAEGLWLDGSGGAFDHANLLVDLAREAGFPARYVLGETQLDAAAAKSMLKVTSAQQACNVLAVGGTPGLVNGQTNCAALSGPVTSITMLHVWAEVSVGGSWKAFDPSRKGYQQVSGADLWGLAGTSATTAWGQVSAGVSEGPNTISGLSAAQTASALTAYGTAIQTALRTSSSVDSADVTDLAGGWRRSHTRSFAVTTSTNPGTPIAYWAGDVPSPYRATFSITAPGFQQTWDLPTYYADRIQAQMAHYADVNGNSTGPARFKVYVRRCEGFASIASRDACATANTFVGANVTAAWDRSFSISINHPFAAQGGTYADETVVKTTEVGLLNELVLRVGKGSATRLARHRQEKGAFLPATYIPGSDICETADYGDSSPYCYAVLDPSYENTRGSLPQNVTMNLTGTKFSVGEHARGESAAAKDDTVNTWSFQLNRAITIVEGLADARILEHHSIGVATADGSAMTVSDRLIAALDIDTAIGVASGSGNSPHEIAVALATFSSAAEATALSERLEAYSDTSGRAVAGIHIGGTGGSLSVLRAGASLSSYSPAAQQEIARYLSAGFEILANQGATPGTFLLARKPDGSEHAWLMAAPYESSGLTNPPRVTVQSAYRKGAAPVANPYEYMQKPSAADTGQWGSVTRTGGLSFTERPDIAFGQGGFPYSLTFERTYASDGAGDPSLGPGWTHNWASSAEIGRSDAAQLLDENNAQAAVPSLVTLMVLLKGAEDETLKSAAVSAMVASWWSERVRDVASVTVGGSTTSFVKHLDGQWRDVGGTGETLTATWVPNTYTLITRRLRDGSEQRFVPGSISAPNGARSRYSLSKWTFPSGVIIDLAYGATVGTTVSNNLGVKLEIVHGAFPEPQTCSVAPSAEACSGSPYKGRVERVRALTPASQVLQEVVFDYAGHCPTGSNLCTTTLATATQTGRRVRRYEYASATAFPLHESEAIPAFSLLTKIKEDGVAAPRAIYEWATVGVHWRPQVRNAVDGFGHATSYRSPGVGRSAVTNALGGQTISLLADQRVVASRDPVGRIARNTYDGRGRTSAQTSAWGDVTSFKYDARGNVVETERSPRAGCGTDTLYWCQTSVVTATYHPTWNKPLSVTLPATGPDAQSAHTWTFAYNAQGLLATQTSPVVFDGKNNVNASAVSRIWYDAYGRVNRTQDATGVETRMEYGGYSQPAWCLTRSHAADQSAALRQTSTFTCTTAGDVLTAADPRGNVTTFTYDALRQKKTEVGPASTGIQAQWDYDLDGNVTQERRWDSTAAAWRATTTTYSLTGKPLTVTDPAGDMARTCYDVLDRPVVTVDPTGRANRTTYNLAGQPTQVERWFTANLADATCALTNTRPAHLTTNRWRAMEYNSGGLQSAEIDGNGNATTMTYDGLGRPMVTTFADGKFMQTIRNERGEVTHTVKRSGDVHQAYYDPMGRVHRVWEHAAGALTDVGRITRSSFDLAGRPVLTDVSTQTTTTWNNALLRDIRTYGYDAAGRVQFDRVTPNNGTMGSTQQILTYGYDTANNRDSIQWPDGYTATYRYDAANRADRVTFGTHQADIALDSLSRRTSLNRSNGVNTAYAYETDNDLSQINHAWAPSAGQTAAIYGLQHDQAGRVTGLSINRPDLEWAPSLAYAQTYGVPTNLNQTTSRNGTGLVWDDNGNLDSYGTTDYQWTWGNRLARVVRPGSTTEYAYDSIDRRTVAIEDGVMTRTLWSGADEVGEYDLAGVLKRRFIPDGSGSMDARLATVNLNNTIHWHHTDHQGSVVATSNAAGQAAGFTNYAPHGEFGTGAGGVPLTAPPTGSPFGYAGRQWDAKAGVYQYRARYYDPVLGIFLSVDPIGTKDDPNLYMYVALDPVNNTDPTGRTCRNNGSRQDCTLDNPGDLSPEELRIANRNYTAAVNALLENGGRTAFVNGQGRRVSAREVAAILIGMHVEGDKYGNRYGSSDRALAPGSNSDRRDPGGRVGGRKIIIMGLSIRQDERGGTSNIDYDLQNQFVHEGIHHTRGEPRRIGGMDHKWAYMTAADELLRPRSWLERLFGQ